MYLEDRTVSIFTRICSILVWPHNSVLFDVLVVMLLMDYTMKVYVSNENYVVFKPLISTEIDE